MSDLLESIQRELDKLPTTTQFSRKKCYRVPKMLRQQNEDAFTPILVSIGPFHHKNEGLLSMETHKLEYVRSFIKDPESELKSCIEIIKDKETQIRECYGESIDMSSDDFVRMVLIDSAFIIELFRNNVIKTPFNGRGLAHDLQLAENQLPFFILQDLYWAAFNSAGHSTAFTDIACTWLGVDKRRVKVDPNTNEAEECCHLVDLMRSHHLPLKLSQQQLDTNVSKSLDVLQPKTFLSANARSLREAGVKFCVANSRKNLLDINFSKEKGILTIPRLIVHDDTELLFRNLIAFEQCHYYPYNYLTDYLFFMDFLIDTKEDVHLLSKNGKIHNWTGSEAEVACLINSISTHAYTSHHYYYARISKQLNQHCMRRWNSYRATLVHAYFKHPWALVSLIYAVILLILTIIQVITGILSM